MHTRNLLLTNVRARILKAAVVYNLCVFTTFFLVYFLMDFDTHFATSKAVSDRGKLYFAVMIHTSSGSADIVPKTDTARLVTALHVTLSWMQIMLVFLS